MTKPQFFTCRRTRAGEFDVSFAEAVRRCVEQHASSTKEQGKRWLRFNAWWRDGKGLNASLDLQSGFVTDWTSGEKLDARAMAKIVNQDFQAFMEGIPSRVVPKPPREPEREGMPDLWERLLEVEQDLGRRDAPAARWLRKVRGFPDDVDVTLDSGFVTVGRASVDAFPPSLRAWARQTIEQSGIHIAAPLRDAVTAEIRTLQLRPIGAASATGKRRWIPGTSLQAHDTAAPRGYGFAHMARSAALTVFAEGFADTAAIELFLRGQNDAVAVGAASSSTVQHWAGIFSCAKGRVVVVPQIDKPRPNCQHCGAPTTTTTCPKCERRHNPGEESQRAMAGLTAALLRLDQRVSVFDWDTFLAAACPGVEPTEVKDVANAVRLAGFSRSREAFMLALEGSA